MCVLESAEGGPPLCFVASARQLQKARIAPPLTFQRDRRVPPRGSRIRHGLSRLRKRGGCGRKGDQGDEGKGSAAHVVVLEKGKRVCGSMGPVAVPHSKSLWTSEDVCVGGGAGEAGRGEKVGGGCVSSVEKTHTKTRRPAKWRAVAASRRWFAGLAVTLSRCVTRRPPLVSHRPASLSPCPLCANGWRWQTRLCFCFAAPLRCPRRFPHSPPPSAPPRTPAAMLSVPLRRHPCSSCRLPPRTDVDSFSATKIEHLTRHTNVSRSLTQPQQILKAHAGEGAPWVGQGGRHSSAVAHKKQRGAVGAEKKRRAGGWG